jgi:iron complex outermembrane receptor protein
MDLRTASGSLDTTTVGSDEGSSPHHQARIQSFFDLSRNVELSLTFRYVGDLPFYLIKGYETGDARVVWRPVQHVEFAVVGQNLLQPHHAEFGGDPGPLVGIKRSVFASLTVRK